MRNNYYYWWYNGDLISPGPYLFHYTHSVHCDRKNNLFACALWTAVLVGWAFGSTDMFSEQAEGLVSRVRMSEEQLQKVPRVLEDLEMVLRTRWPGVQVAKFGSTGSGLALAQSDVDVFVRLPRSTGAPEAVGATGGALVQEAVTLLERHPDLFTDFVVRPNMTVPFMTFRHIPTGFPIDVLFNVESPLKDTELLRYLVNTDKRVLNLAIIVKHWAKVQHVTTPRVLTSSALMYLVVFYLQQVDMLPPVATLQSGAEPYFDDNGWNLAFNEVAYRPRNESSLYRLLGGFFEYYTNFNYDEYMISVYLGRPVKKVLFDDLQSVPVEFEAYRRNVGQRGKTVRPLSCPRVCLQQPFVHNDMLGDTRRLDSSANSTFVTQFKRATRIYRQNADSEFLDRLLEIK